MSMKKAQSMWRTEMTEKFDECKLLKTKLNLAIKAMNAAGNYLACMDDLSELTGECNEQMALNELTKALDKIKEIKND